MLWGEIQNKKNLEPLSRPEIQFINIFNVYLISIWEIGRFRFLNATSLDTTLCIWYEPRLAESHSNILFAYHHTIIIVRRYVYIYVMWILYVWKIWIMHIQQKHDHHQLAIVINQINKKGFSPLTLQSRVYIFKLTIKSRKKMLLVYMMLWQGIFNSRIG